MPKFRIGRHCVAWWRVTGSLKMSDSSLVRAWCCIPTFTNSENEWCFQVLILIVSNFRWWGKFLLSLLLKRSCWKHSSIKLVGLHVATLAAIDMGSKSSISRTAMNHGSIHWQATSLSSGRVVQVEPRLMECWSWVVPFVFFAHVWWIPAVIYLLEPMLYYQHPLQDRTPLQTATSMWLSAKPSRRVYIVMIRCPPASYLWWYVAHLRFELTLAFTVIDVCETIMDEKNAILMMYRILGRRQGLETSGAPGSIHIGNIEWGQEAGNVNFFLPGFDKTCTPKYGNVSK